MTPQMGGNLAFHRRQPVRPCPDETVCSERFGVCIRKTCYRTEQEDRVSLENRTELHRYSYAHMVKLVLKRLLVFAFL